MFDCLNTFKSTVFDTVTVISLLFSNIFLSGLLQIQKNWM